MTQLDLAKLILGAVEARCEELREHLVFHISTDLQAKSAIRASRDAALKEISYWQSQIEQLEAE